MKNAFKFLVLATFFLLNVNFNLSAQELVEKDSMKETDSSTISIKTEKVNKMAKTKKNKLLKKINLTDEQDPEIEKVMQEYAGQRVAINEKTWDDIKDQYKAKEKLEVEHAEKLKKILTVKQQAKLKNDDKNEK